MSLLRVSHIKKHFKEVKAVDDISFEIEKGEILGLLGPNGAGKSTTISMIATLLKPDSGNIYYQGKDIIKNPKYIQKKLGYVPQEIALYPTLSGYENLVFWGRAYGLKGNSLKNRIECVSKVIGIDKRLKDPVRKYSGGMKRRLNIGVAILHEPDIVIMDEPTVGIDPQSRNHILETVKSLSQQGVTVIYTSHYMEEVEYLCKKICIMDQGKIIAEGTKKQLVQLMSKNKHVIVTLDCRLNEIMKELEKLNIMQHVDIKENQLILTIKDNKDGIKELVKTISMTGANIISIDTKEPNLESVFLHLTGRGLRD